MVLIFTLLSLGCWVILNRYTENWKSCEFFLLPSPNHDPYGYSPVIVKFGVWKSVSCSDWDNSEMSFTFQSYPARNSWSLPSAGLFPAVTLGLLCPLSLPCFPHSLTSLSWEHFLNKWLAHTYHPQDQLQQNSIKADAERAYNIPCLLFFLSQ